MKYDKLDCVSCTEKCPLISVFSDTRLWVFSMGSCWTGSGARDRSQGNLQPKTLYVFVYKYLTWENVLGQENLRLGDVMRTGMLFVWVDERSLYLPICEAAERMGFVYKDCIVWGKKNVSNRIINESSPEHRYFNRSSSKCLLFRRVKILKNGKPKNVRFELRHQRSADVIIRCVRRDPGFCRWGARNHESDRGCVQRTRRSS